MAEESIQYFPRANCIRMGSCQLIQKTYDPSPRDMVIDCPGRISKTCLVNLNRFRQDRFVQTLRRNCRLSILGMCLSNLVIDSLLTIPAQQLENENVETRLKLSLSCKNI